MIISLILLQASALQCAASYRDALVYQSQINGDVLRRTVDNPNGHLEYIDGQAILKEIDTAIQPDLEELRTEALSATAARCQSIDDVIHQKIAVIIRKDFAHQ